MKRIIIMLVLSLCGFIASSCASDGYNMQKGAAIGTIGGALAGQAIGQNTAGTLIGAAGGALVGAVAGNAVDQNETQTRQTQPRPAAVPRAGEPPPGRWVEVPGQWVGGKWLPAHRVWTPDNPGGLEDNVDVNVQVAPPPAYTLEAPPSVTVIPGSYVYFVPGVTVDILFYHGYWYRPYRGYWYRSAYYNGPWMHLPYGRVPHALISLPRDYSRISNGYRPIPHAVLQRNGDRWEREGHWDRGHGRS